MADDPMTVVSVTNARTVGLGVRRTTLLVKGPADYDATNGAAFDLSSYVTSIYSVAFTGVTAKEDALAIPRYVNDDWTDADGGAVYFSWSGTAAAVLDNVTDTTALDGYEWQCVIEGSPP